MSGIQYDQVAHAADSLASRGERPTIRNVREILSAGSQTTLARFELEDALISLRQD